MTAARADAERRTEIGVRSRFARGNVDRDSHLTFIRTCRHILTRLGEQDDEVKNEDETEYSHFALASNIPRRSSGTGIDLKNHTFEAPVLPVG